jgi:molybdenum cofactor guanylyltransferase
MASTAVLLLAGGESRRFPGKLEHRVDGCAMVAQVCERVRATGLPIFIAARASFSRPIDAQLGFPMLIDRRPGGGPVQAFLSACTQIRAERVFAVAADQPRLDASVLDALRSAWRPDDEAVVPEHDGKIEPLAALYERCAILREGFELRRRRATSMRELIARVAARFVTLDRRYFQNVNRLSDLE